MAPPPRCTAAANYLPVMAEAACLLHLGRIRRTAAGSQGPMQGSRQFPVLWLADNKEQFLQLRLIDLICGARTKWGGKFHLFILDLATRRLGRQAVEA